MTASRFIGSDPREPARAHALTPAPGRGGAPASSGQRGRGGGIETVDEAEPQPLQPGPGDHRRIVGAQRRRRRQKVEPGRSGETGEALAQPGIGGDPAGRDEASALWAGCGETRRSRWRCDRTARRRSPARPRRRDRLGLADRAGHVRWRCGAPRSSARKTRNRSPVGRRAGAAGQSGARRPLARPARSPGRRDSRDRSVWRSCRRPRRRRRRGWCRGGYSGRPRRRPAAGNGRPRPAAADRETRHRPVSRTLSAWASR